MIRWTCPGLILLLCCLTGAAQHHHEAHPPMDSTRQAEPEAATMSSTLLPNLPMQKDGSGTSWLPDQSPVHAIHSTGSGWQMMVHGRLYLRYTAQDAFESGNRGEEQWEGPTWFMIMAQRPLGRRSQVGLRGMFSLDPLVHGGRGYPLLFQTGETFGDKPLIDRQHPHDLFSELAVVLGHALNAETGIFAYAGMPGEPALGPTAFMHRPSALHNPNSPLGHHWQDASHITFGVATIGARWRMFKLDGSVFTGREPDEERFGFDEPRFDSYSLRLEVSPAPRWTVQVSRGRLTSPEVLHPDEDQWRTTASAIYHLPIAAYGFWSHSMVWGMNEIIDGHDGEPGEQSTLLWEGDLEWEKNVFYHRAEYVEKPGGDLGFPQYEERSFPVKALTLGVARSIAGWRDLELQLGGQGTFYGVPKDLQADYGEAPVSVEVYLALSPSLMVMGHGAMKHGQHP